MSRYGLHKDDERRVILKHFDDATIQGHASLAMRATNALYEMGVRGDPLPFLLKQDRKKLHLIRWIGRKGAQFLNAYIDWRSAPSTRADKPAYPRIVWEGSFSDEYTPNIPIRIVELDGGGIVIESRCYGMGAMHNNAMGDPIWVRDDNLILHALARRLVELEGR